MQVQADLHRSVRAAVVRERSINIMKNAPLVSIIIPNLNGAHHLPVCLESLRHQTWSHFEVILVDNGSSDESLALLARDFPEVRVIALNENQGFAPACNMGIRAARGEIVALLNNDTEADGGWLEAIVATFARYPHAGAVASKMLLFERRDHFHTAGIFTGSTARRATAVSGNGMKVNWISMRWPSAPMGAAPPTAARC